VGLVPGSGVGSKTSGDAIRVALELTGDIPHHSVQVASMQGGHVVASGPPNRSCDAPVGASCGDALCEPNEIAQTSVRPEAHDDMDMIRQNCFAQHMNTGLLARPRHSALHIDGREPIDACHPLPGVPRDMRIHLVGMVCGHVFAWSVSTDPGRKPGVNRSPPAVRRLSHQHSRRELDAVTKVLPPVTESCMGGRRSRLSSPQPLSWGPVSDPTWPTRRQRCNASAQSPSCRGGS